MCKILSAYGTPWKDVSLTNNMYKTTTAKVISHDGETDTFEIQAGALQGDKHAPSLCITVLDYCFRIKSRQSRRIRKQTITDLGFGDDLALLSDTVEQAQEILLSNASGKS